MRPSEHQEILLSAGGGSPPDTCQAMSPHSAQIHRKKILLYMNRSRSASREGIISAGIRQRARKAICWEAATSWPHHDAPSHLPLFSSQCWPAFRQLPRVGQCSTAATKPHCLSFSLTPFMYSPLDGSQTLVQVAQCLPVRRFSPSSRDRHL